MIFIFRRVKTKYICLRIFCVVVVSVNSKKMGENAIILFFDCFYVLFVSIRKYVVHSKIRSKKSEARLSLFMTDSGRFLFPVSFVNSYQPPFHNYLISIFYHLFNLPRFIATGCTAKSSSENNEQTVQNKNDDDDDM